MKRIIILTLVITAALTQATAQTFTQNIKDEVKDIFSSMKQDFVPTGEHDQWDIFIAPKIGATSSNMTNVGGKKIKPWFTGGFFVEVFFIPNLAMDVEMNYSRQGADGVPGTAPGDNGEKVYAERSYRMDYINTAYLCRWYPKKTIPFSMYTGFQIGRLINAKAEVNAPRRLVQDIKGDLHSGELSIPVGLSYEFGQLQVDARYNFHPKRIAHSDDAKRVLGNARFNFFSLSLAYRILWF